MNAPALNAQFRNDSRSFEEDCAERQKHVAENNNRFSDKDMRKTETWNISQPGLTGFEDSPGTC